jgi:aminoglycoside phosphotransferase (APT) family kinase protein
MAESTREERAGVYDAMNDALARLHTIDIAAAGLSDFGKAGNYFQRQWQRWSEQYRASETQEIADMNRLIDWLGANMPADDGRVGLVHGDYRIDNMIFDAQSTRLLAVLDWELSTLGHPFADLAYQCMQWRLPNAGDFRGLGGLDRKALGIPSEEEYVALYCKRTGLSEVPHWNFLIAFSFFRVGAIVQGVYKRALDGNASNPERGRRMGAGVPIMAKLAMEMAEGRG